VTQKSPSCGRVDREIGPSWTEWFATGPPHRAVRADALDRV